MASRAKTPAPVARTSSRPERQQHSKQRSSSRWPRVSPGALWDTGDQLPLPSMWGGKAEAPGCSLATQPGWQPGVTVQQRGRNHGEWWRLHMAWKGARLAGTPGSSVAFQDTPRRSADTLPCPGLTSQPLLSSGLGSNFRLLSRKAGQGEAPGSQSASLAQRPAPASSALTSHQSGAAG